MVITTIGLDLTSRILILSGPGMALLLLWAWAAYHDHAGASQLDDWSTHNQQRSAGAR